MISRNLREQVRHVVGVLFFLLVASGRYRELPDTPEYQDMRFDVPAIGVKTIEVMRKAGAACLALDAYKCLLLDGNAIISAADAGEIAIVAD